METESNIRRDMLERLVRELIGGDQGKKMKNKSIEWKKLAEKAAGPDGSSSVNLGKLVNKFLHARS